ncbi:MAG: 30S ribosomal protein S2, partial [Acidobacteria bacterium]|nr:30S ribosomal protein S2 [Acidobacteriota bacterium]
MIQVTMREMLEAGVHFGHQTRRWNPKMKRDIFGKRNGIYIIDLQKTSRLLEEALEFTRSLGYAGRKLLFVGTKRQAQDVVSQEAERCGQYYVSHRWLGGMLTNFVTIRNSIDRLQEIEDRIADEDKPLLKKEKIRLDREYAKINRNLEGIRGMDGLPDALFVIDPKREHIAVGEANRLGIPVIAIVDTNCDPEEVDYVIPGNDDAIRTIRLFAAAVADAYLDGAKGLAEAIVQAEKDAEPEPVDAEAVASVEEAVAEDELAAEVELAEKAEESEPAEVVGAAPAQAAAEASVEEAVAEDEPVAEVEVAEKAEESEPAEVVGAAPAQAAAEAS